MIRYICNCLTSFTHLQQQGRYDDDYTPAESSLQALEGEGDFMQGFFATVSRPLL